MSGKYCNCVLSLFIINRDLCWCPSENMGIRFAEIVKRRTNHHCNVAISKMNKLQFIFQDQVIQHNQKGGIIMSSGDLALQGVTRIQAGNYSCVASNVEGDGDSNKVELKIMCKHNSHIQLPYHSSSSQRNCFISIQSALTSLRSGLADCVQ